MASTKYLKGECQHCQGHLEFPAEHTGLVADCPHCGQATELLLARPPEEPAVPRRALMYALVALIILGLGLAASLVALRLAENRAARLKPKPDAVKPEPGAGQSAGTPIPDDPLAQQGFAASPIRIEKASGTSLVYAVGSLKNITGRQRFGVKIELELVDSAGGKIGTATDYQQVLEAEAEWRFRALVMESKAVSAKLISVKEDQ